jgi:hypothetical protein
MFIGKRKPGCNVLKHVRSTSGKYELFYGIHYTAGKTCFDCGTVNQLTGEIVTRHYVDGKAEALRAYHEFEKGLTSPATPEEDTAWTADAFRRALKS